MDGAALLDELADRLGRHGLRLRGGFDFAEGEAAPARAVLLIGNAGADYWPHFQAWLRERQDRPENPLDTWSRGVIGAAAEVVGARAVSPSDRPYLPFQQWAMRAEGLRASPLGILMHPEFGLWHAYRGALLFDRPLGMPAPGESVHRCDLCRAKPCLRACPVGAHSVEGFAYGRCLSFVREEFVDGDGFPLSVSPSVSHLSPLRRERKGAKPSTDVKTASATSGTALPLPPEGGEVDRAKPETERGNHASSTTDLDPSGAPCRGAGCLDRNACPVGTAFRYPAEVQAFHMAAFAGL